MKLVIRLYAVILLGYTGWRTYDFISSTLPKNDISLWLGIAFLFATEIGMALWHEIGLGHVTTKRQEDIAKTMTWINFVASLSAGIADMILRQTFIEGYVIPRALADVLVYGLPGVMALNVASIIMYEQNDETAKLEAKKRQVRFKVYQEALKDLEMAAEEIAQDKKIPVYQSLRAEITGQVDAKYNGKIKTSDVPPVRQKAASKSIIDKMRELMARPADSTSNVPVTQPNPLAQPPELMAQPTTSANGASKNFTQRPKG